MCSTTQHCIEQEIWDPDAQMWDYDYYCDECPNGKGHSADDCFTCVSLPKCDGYDDTCPSGVESDKKCKQVSGCPNSCQKYEICDINTGAITVGAYPINSCHLEGGSACYSNTVPCSTFVVDHFAVGWNCDDDAQVNDATWNATRNAWDTINCSCSVVDRDIVHDVGGAAADVHCIKANADFYVADADRYRTTSVEGSVVYSFRREFCRQCEAGYLPQITNSPDSYGIILRPAGSSGNWGVIQCNTVVRAPYYADGCIINFNLSNGTAAINDSNCSKTCPAGTIIEDDGATSADQCVTDPSQRFTDRTGTFTIGAGMCSTGGQGRYIKQQEPPKFGPANFFNFVGDIQGGLLFDFAVLFRVGLFKQFGWFNRFFFCFNVCQHGI